MSVQSQAPTATSPRSTHCATCGDRLIGLDWFRDVCAWCQPEDTALCPSCYGSGAKHYGDETDDCLVCYGSGRITTRAGAAQLEAGAA